MKEVERTHSGSNFIPNLYSMVGQAVKSKDLIKLIDDGLKYSKNYK